MFASFLCLNEEMTAVGEEITASCSHSTASFLLEIIYEFRNDEENKDVYMVALRDDDGKLIGYYEKHAYRNRETARLYDFGK